MTTTELHDLEALLERALPDPRGFMDRVLQQLLDRLATEPSSLPGPGDFPKHYTQAHPQPEDHNLVLAAALGACECWGHDPDCADCAGAGFAGWVDPDARLYQEYVTPAIKRMQDPSAATGDTYQPSDDLPEGELT
jgi:hypothetical protein